MMKYKDNNFFSIAHDVKDQLIDVSHVILVKAAIMVKGTAVVLAPYRTGILKGSITYEIFKNYAIVGTNIEYAPYQEYLYDNPFMRPAVDNNRSNVNTMANKELQKVK